MKPLFGAQVNGKERNTTPDCLLLLAIAAKKCAIWKSHELRLTKQNFEEEKKKKSEGIDTGKKSLVADLLIIQDHSL